MEHGFFKGAEGQKMAFCSKKGSDKWMIFLHGLGSDYSGWEKQYSFFSKLGYSVAGFDFRGHGRSEASKDLNYYKLENLAKDLEFFIKFLGAKKPILVGHCFGGIILQEYQKLYPNRASYVIMASSPESRNIFFRKFFSLPPKMLPVTKDRSSFVHRKEKYYTGVSDWSVKRLSYALYKTGIVSYFSCLSHIFNHNASNDLASFKTPVTIIVGKKDRIFPLHKSKEIAKKINNSRFHIIPNVNHILVVNAGNEINEIIKGDLKFLES